MMSQSISGVGRKIPVTIITGFLGAGKTTLLRNLLAQANGRRIAIVVNEFGSLGIDGEVLRSCSIENCPDEDIVELTNGCLCCTVADDFIPTMQALIDRPDPPEHIVIETSGLALPKPLLKAFSWPDIRTRMTVDGVITLVDAPAVAAGRFADDPAAVAAQRAADPSLDHDNPLAEVYEDQLNAADLIVLNKTDLLESTETDAVEAAIVKAVPRKVVTLRAVEGRLDPAVLLGIGAGAEDDLQARPSNHDGADDHEHDDFESFVVVLPEQSSAEALLKRLSDVAGTFDILRMKGFMAIQGKKMRLAVQGVGTRFRHEFDVPLTGDNRDGRLVVIGQTGLDRAAIEAALLAA
ncbi:cobalamin synthesis protein CobW [Gluconobacter thailandicus F149-1 = NBRC 100600]|uniref:Cobalamin synthesis protein CobW n=1 Tax=Gluconobacter thailandicus NBRC 3257 TaxID=1381097 RepID=A0ABQ0IZQ8_GLUTH|nr:cobalamin biosynthesis protein CobW [Gluconobacter thailandicus]GAC88162.1 cobalamin synthesis protein CobW [Gluconobacter thailandicus NBRC 3255]GAD27689.1 cobalamin synthesis protein CobW [Gluconobacter thailandicus NBRC 3257]GAN93158.1 cobalamin synthesis protein CobW [Gluconobacter thailandicus F149-1 = NBRC 100600]GEL86943.1 cobalamin biosynthesis protein CobW [Gluconobacter thailandicus F149-1 = NBRC 100600]